MTLDKYKKEEKLNNQKNKTIDPRKHPKPGYDEKNPSNKNNVQDHPENQNTG